MLTPCHLCDGSGLRLVEAPDGTRYAGDCECRIEQRSVRRVRNAAIPARYEHCTLANYDDFPSAHRTQREALFQATQFVKAYPANTGDKGLLLTGSIGIGKTHLAVGILRGLITERGVHGLFIDYRDLLKEVQNSYNRGVAETELSILRPVFDAEVLVLDELGAAKPTEWVWDTVAHILNTRYNDRRTTILTSNYPNLTSTAAGASSSATSPEGARAALREETLGDRIGDRMWSRLQEMCASVEMRGEDFRQGVKRARFG